MGMQAAGLDYLFKGQLNKDLALGGQGCAGAINT